MAWRRSDDGFVDEEEGEVDDDKKMNEKRVKNKSKSALL